ncbi:MAG: NAD+ synthase [Candidatus Caenarcaniphilales bacterium]|jgi:NAD+ synthase (glutamine-hydrolysing)|nr:NAD+ synthase [Candidatus Caenarcaniphilales bacterium]
MKLALAQANPIVGDFKYNLDKAISFVKKARELSIELLIFSEMFLIGYPPQDLLLKSGVIEAHDYALNELAKYTDDDFGIIIGGIALNQNYGKKYHNSLFCLASGTVQQTAHKMLLPTYDVFDETRYFEPAQEVSTWSFKGLNIGLSICEDIWIEAYTSLYKRNPINELVAKRVDLIVNSSASPYSFTKPELRVALISSLVKQHSTPLLYINQVGANDQLVFDGNSMVFDDAAHVIAKGKDFEEDLIVVDSHLLKSQIATSSPDYPIPLSNRLLAELTQQELFELRKAIVLGIRDFVSKCGFNKVILGLSGGIDSALVACLCKEALGPSKVFAYMLSTEFTSQESFDDAKLLAQNLSINYSELSIQELLKESRKLIPELTGLADENIQPRLRSSLLMAFANSKTALLMSTSNKSEIAVGYSTLYGDSCGALAPIGDLLKTTVYQLSKTFKEIPESVLEKAPSAELRQNQKDSDSLPDYELLDKIIFLYVQELWSYQKIVNAGFDELIVKKILNMIDQAEYKRHQSPPIVKIAGIAFGMGRRMPIAQHYSHK